MRQGRNLCKWTVSVLWWLNQSVERQSRRAEVLSTNICPWESRSRSWAALTHLWCSFKRFHQFMKSIFISTLSHRGIHLLLNHSNPWNSSVSSSWPAGWTSRAMNQMFLPSKKKSATRHCGVEHPGRRAFYKYVSEKLYKNIPLVDFDQSQGLIGHCGKYCHGFIMQNTLWVHWSYTSLPLSVCLVSSRGAFMSSSWNFERKKERFAKSHLTFQNRKEVCNFNRLGYYRKTILTSY